MASNECGVILLGPFLLKDFEMIFHYNTASGGHHD